MTLGLESGVVRVVPYDPEWPSLFSAESERLRRLLDASHAETLGARVIPDNYNASIDPRWRRDSIVVVLTQPMLAEYGRGFAILRAYAIGGPQWLRTPPPLVRETRVELVARSGDADTSKMFILAVPH